MDFSRPDGPPQDRRAESPQLLQFPLGPAVLEQALMSRGCRHPSRPAGFLGWGFLPAGGPPVEGTASATEASAFAAVVDGIPNLWSAMPAFRDQGCESAARARGEFGKER